MKRGCVVVSALAAIAFYWFAGCSAVCAAGGKIDLKVLYAGHPDSTRERDFVEFLREYFREVGRGNLTGFKEEDARGFDVVILDYDGDGSEAPIPRLSRAYSRATVTVGVVGASIGGSLGLKTAYL